MRILVVDFANSMFTHHHFRDPDPGFNFLVNIRRMVEQFKIDRIVFAAEGGKSKYRLSIHPEYKANRAKRYEEWDAADRARYDKFKTVEMPETLRLAKMLGISVISVPGVEADDIFAWLCQHIDTDKHQVLLLSTDKDANQLLRPGVVQAGYNKKVTEPCFKNEKIPPALWINHKHFSDQYEIEPWQFAHVLALAGDTADNFLSPKGIGEGAALKLVQKYGDIWNLEKNLDTVEVPRLGPVAKENLRKDYHLVHRNFRLANLLHSKETELEIFGVEGIQYLQDALASLIYTPEIDEHNFKEYLYEFGKVNVASRLESWLGPFRGSQFA